MLATFAFDVCHDVYRVAREVIDSKIPTMNLESSGKYMWHPDRMPRLAEYVCDFARAGERALEGNRLPEASDLRRSRSLRDTLRANPSIDALRVNPSIDALRVNPSRDALRINPPREAIRASRMVMFRLYYLGGAEYQAARRLLGVSELTWADWAEEVRTRVGRELTSAGVFPPSKYFLKSSLRAGEDELLARCSGAAG